MSTIDFTFTEPAAGRIAEIIESQNLSDQHFFRLAVNGGGCAGFEYEMAMDDQLADDDIILETNGIKMAIDSVSAPYLEGGALEYQQSLGGSLLKVTNPNASSSCGCGVSFSMKE